MSGSIISERRESSSAISPEGLYFPSGSNNNLKMTLTAKEAAAAVGVSMPIFYALCQRPDFPSFRIGKKVLINRNALQEWIDRQSGTDAK